MQKAITRLHFCSTIMIPPTVMFSIFVIITQKIIGFNNDIAMMCGSYTTELVCYSFFAWFLSISVFFPHFETNCAKNGLYSCMWNVIAPLWFVMILKKKMNKEILKNSFNAIKKFFLQLVPLLQTHKKMFLLCILRQSWRIL